MENLELENQDEIEVKKRHPLYTFTAISLMIALVILSIPGYFYLMHPQPVNIPVLEDVQKFLPEEVEEPFTTHKQSDIKDIVRTSSEDIKQVANFIAAKSCKKADRVCQSRAMYYFVRDNIQYVPDENFKDKVSSPVSTLQTGGADCEDMALLTLALEKAIGNTVRMVYIPGHAYAQVQIPDYKGDNWINLEATCQVCTFGELPNNSALAKKNYIEL